MQSSLLTRNIHRRNVFLRWSIFLIDPFTVLLTFHIMGPVRENRRHHWKKRPKISKGAKFESDKWLNPLSPSIYLSKLISIHFLFCEILTVLFLMNFSLKLIGLFTRDRERVMRHERRETHSLATLKICEFHQSYFWTN